MTCPLCGAKHKQAIESDYVFGGKESDKYIHCEECDLFYLHPKPSEEELLNFYKNDFEKFMTNRSGKDSDWSNAEKHAEISKRDAIRRMSFLEETLETSKTILEVGASTGFMLDHIKDSFSDLKVSAIEPSDYFCSFMRNKGIEAYQSLNELPEDKKFDLIIHFFVVAHVFNFKQFIAEYYEKLNVGGKMIFETPSTTDALRGLYDIPEFHKFYRQVAHIVSFNPNSMKKFLDEMGYKYTIKPHQRYDLSNHMVWMQTGKPGGQGKFKIFSDELIEKYKEDLKKSWNCDTVILKIYK
jgi:2-polyprenyl-3-methyl-5-hydroxy-6-metoxy-1,4-benzoquinol methylase